MDDYSERIRRLSPEKRELLLEQLRRTEALPPPPPCIPRREDPAHARLSFAQQRLWFLDQLQCDHGGYQMVGGLHLEGQLDRTALRRALQTIVDRHEIFRTTFQELKGEPWQNIHPVRELALTPVDLRAVPPAEQDRAVQTFLKTCLQEEFDLKIGPLFRTWLMELGPTSHVLVLAFHHIVVDAWSNDILCRELTECYRAFASGDMPELPALPIQYADFAEWQRSAPQVAALDEQIGYWRAHLAGLQPLRLLTDEPGSESREVQGASEERYLTGPVVDALREFSRREGVTLYMTLLACFQTLLSRYTGQTDIAVGTPVANRYRSDMENLIGFFVNTLVMRNDLSGNPPFRELLARVKESTIDAYAHQELPFDRLVEALHPERSRERNPLFQVTFAVQNSPRRSLQLAGLTLSPLECEVATTRFDLELHVWEYPGELRLLATYNRQLFPAETVVGLLRHLETLVRGVLENPDQRLSDLSLFEPEEVRQLTENGNRPVTEFPRHAGLFELFQNQVSQTPDAVGTVCDGEGWTYRELAASSGNVAEQLRRQGLQAEERVALAIEPSLGLVAATLGVIEARGAYVPLDLEAPAARWQHVLSKCGCRIVLTDAAHRQSVSSVFDGLVLDMDALLQAREITGGRAFESQSPPTNDVPADRLAYVMYTSGTTGLAKGIAVEQRSVVRLVRNTNYIQIGSTDVIALLSNFAFDGATFEFWGALLNGARLVITPKNVALSPDSFRDHVRRHGINVAFVTTSLFGYLARSAADIFYGFRAVLFGGEVADPLLVRQIAASGWPKTLFHVYGPTESTTFATSAKIESVADDAKTIPIGHPLSNTEVYVLDDRMQPVPRGVAGQLYLGGDGLARGYLRSPALTAACFVPHPFSQQPGQRLYATGDFVRSRHDGSLEFLYRQDRQVKLRGFRIELAEVEAALRQHAGVELAAAFVLNDAESGDRLVAYVQTPESAPATSEQLLQFVRQRLPTYMLPSAVFCRPRLPMNSFGKVDYASLLEQAQLEPFADDHEMPAEHDTPRNPIEAIVQEIFRELLRVKRVPLQASLFELGGHSLLATQLVSRLRDVFQMELPLGAVFQEPSVDGLSLEISKRLEGDRDAALPTLQPLPDGSALAASCAQRRLWFLQRMQPRGGAWHIPWVVELRGPLELSALQQGLEHLVKRHASLRTHFVEIDGAPLPVIDAVGSAGLQVVDVRSESTEQQALALQQLTVREQRAPFRLETGPLLRSCLLRLSDERSVLCITLHHLIADGWSLGILARELAACYAAFCEGRPPTLPELPVQYGDFAGWQRRCLEQGTWQPQLSYWRKQLSELPALQLPTSRRRQPESGDAGSLVTRQIGAELSRAVREFNRREGASCYMTLLAVFQLLLSRYSGQTDIVVGTPSANRNRHEIEGLIGFFVNSLAIRTDLSGDPTFRELVQRVRAVTLGALANQDIPFERLVEELNPERILNRHPLFDVVFAVQNAADELPDWGPVKVRPSGFEVTTTRYDLQLDVWEPGDALQLNAFYRTGLFDRSIIERLLDHFEALLRTAVIGPDRRLSEYSLLTPEEVQQVAAWNLPSHVETPHASLPDWFRQQAVRTPDHIAVVSPEQQLSYRDLDARSNRLAQCLRRRGVGPETPVGVCVERSGHFVVAMLGVLKAGGAYVPLEPGWPDERIRLLLAETEAPLVICLRESSERLQLVTAGLAAQIVPLDGDEVAAAEPTCPAVALTSQNLAYVIYTSGSAGHPKGVAVTHANVMRLFTSTQKCFSFSEQDVWTLFHSPAFDFSVWEIWGALLNGGRLVIVPYLVSRSPVEFRNWLREHRVTVLNQTPTAFGQLAAVCRPADVPSLRYVIFGGERLDPQLLVGWWDVPSRTLQMVNMYGITETTVHATWGRLDPDDADWNERSWIGSRLPDLQIFLLDDCGHPVPVGVPGEICVGGTGLARGYVRNPALTAERFVPHPYSDVPGDRLYRSGDLACYRPDGALEYVGRRDAQVKVRGFRIELGEIEAALRDQPHVRQAIVISRQEAVDDQRLVAYVVADVEHPDVRSQIATEVSRRLVHWQQVYDDLYGQSPPPCDPTLNLAGWRSSYTGAPIPTEAMREQVDQTVARILALRPRRLFEIGCGTGMLLFRLAPHCAEYLATDLSESALSTLRSQVPEHVTLLQRDAADFSEIQANSLDTIVLNSVVQYFPDAEYLVRVLRGACRVLRPDGVIFVGDVRHYGLWHAFQSAVELTRAADSDTLSEVQQRIQQQMHQEAELLLAPEFFTSLTEQIPEIHAVHIEPKRGRHRHELTEFRYDVRLHLGPAVKPQDSIAWREWGDTQWSAADIQEHLRRETPATFELRGIGNARLEHAVSAVELMRDLPGTQTVEELRRRQTSWSRPALDPEDLWSLSDRLDYDVHLRCGSGKRPDTFDAVFRLRGAGLRSDFRFPTRGPSTKPGVTFNRPWFAPFAEDFSTGLQAALRRRLPDYMLPAKVIVLEQMPLTVQGKIDRRSLPAPDESRPGLETRYAAPRSPLESRLANIWAEVLRVRQVGVHDNFFSLGGHSLLAMQVVARIRDALQLELPLRSLFESPTVAGLAVAVTLAKVEQSDPQLLAQSLDWLRRLPATDRVHPAGGDAAAHE